MRKNDNTKKVKLNFWVLLFSFFVLCTIIYKGIKLSLVDVIDGTNIKTFALSRNIKETTLTANRGSILDVNGNILAETVFSYTVTAYLKERVGETASDPKHVIDKQKTAEELSPIINMSVEDILKLLNKDATQVELGPGGRGITELVKEQIEALNLPGIGFIQTKKRFYPNGDFLSYVIGYAKNNDDGTIVGEMGVESYYNKELSGTDGYYKYVKDKDGIRIPNTPSDTKEPVDGYNIYLTIDNNIQFFAEQASKEAYTKYNPEWVSVTVANAKTGAILATTTTPGFDPNTRNITSYLNSLVSYAFEPGSTMKTYTYMAAMEKGVYNGNATFMSGSIKIGDNTVRDWNRSGWGTITFDVGYALSANTSVSTMMMQGLLTGNELKDYLEKLGFGQKTGIALSNEVSGKINFKYPIEIANASFGQGITTTPIQHIKALTSISNNGVLLNPYIISKIVDPNTGEVVFEGTKSEIGRVASEETVQKIKQLMYNVVHGEPGQSAGRAYNVEGISLFGKTGTAQIADLKNGGYLTGTNDYIRSFEGMFPYEDPEIIIYVAIKGTSANATIETVKSLTTNISKYLKLSEETKSTEMVCVEIDSYINKDTSEVKKILESKLVVPIVLGSGNKIIKQYPLAGSSVMSYDKVFLLTNDYDVKMPNIIGYSAKDVISLSNILGLDYKLNGTGFVTNALIPEGSDVNTSTVLEVTLESKLKTE